MGYSGSVCRFAAAAQLLHPCSGQPLLAQAGEINGEKQKAGRREHRHLCTVIIRAVWQLIDMQVQLLQTVWTPQTKKEDNLTALSRKLVQGWWQRKALWFFSCLGCSEQCVTVLQGPGAVLGCWSWFPPHTHSVISGQSCWANHEVTVASGLMLMVNPCG